MNVSPNSINYTIHHLGDMKVTLDYKLMSKFNSIEPAQNKTIFVCSNSYSCYSLKQVPNSLY